MRRVALVTGGGSGIGLAIASELARTGVSIAVLDLRPGNADDLVSQLLALGAPAACVVEGDLQNLESHDRLIDGVVSELGDIDVLVNNAGVPAKVRGDLLDMSVDAFDHALDINLRGTFFLTQTVARRMLARPRHDVARAIVTISSVSATMVSTERGEYCLSKAALPMLVQLFATRLAPHGIGVYEVRPGIIRTPMTSGVSTRYDTLIEAGLVPAGRWGEAEEVARVVRALAGQDFAFATGSVISADGGLSIARL